jgi:hypothetical protein
MSPRTQDSRTLAQVSKPKGETSTRADVPKGYASEDDRQLRALGWSGEMGPAQTYRKRLDRMRDLARDGKGPLAWLHDVFLPSCRRKP